MELQQRFIICRVTPGNHHGVSPGNLQVFFCFGISSRVSQRSHPEIFSGLILELLLEVSLEFFFSGFLFRVPYYFFVFLQKVLWNFSQNFSLELSWSFFSKCHRTFITDCFWNFFRGISTEIPSRVAQRFPCSFANNLSEIFSRDISWRICRSFPFSFSKDF